jgi:hypothetical protein
MSASDNEYPKYIPCPKHLNVSVRGKANHVFEWPYETDRSGKTWILVENGKQEQDALRVLPRVSVKTTLKG